MDDAFSLKAYAIENNLHEKIRTRFFAEYFKAAPGSIILLKGGTTQSVYDTDTELNFYQEGFFWYMFGVEEPGMIGMIKCDTGEFELFADLLPADLGIWMPIDTCETISAKYGVKTYSDKDLDSVLSELNPSLIYLNYGTNTDSGVEKPTSYLDRTFAFETNSADLYPALCNSRAIKMPEEIELMRRVCRTGVNGHIQAMKTVKGKTHEWQINSEYYKVSTDMKLNNLAFTPICGSGNNASILHYPTNERKIEAGDLLLQDAGTCGYGYCSDITRTFPTSGHYSEKQKGIYRLVCESNLAVEAALKPGVEWTDMHLLADKIHIAGLKNLGLLQGDVDEMLEKRVGAVFMPHGLGHLVGITVHDVGGYTKGPERSPLPGLKSLRTRRTMEVGLVITVEPGIYFIDFLLDGAKENPEIKDYFVWEKVDEYRGFGGVRIEDIVAITETGCDLLSPAPKTVEEIEATINGE